MSFFDDFSQFFAIFPFSLSCAQKTSECTDKSWEMKIFFGHIRKHMQSIKKFHGAVFFQFPIENKKFSVNGKKKTGNGRVKNFISNVGEFEYISCVKISV